MRTIEDERIKCAALVNETSRRYKYNYFLCGYVLGRRKYFAAYERTGHTACNINPEKRPHPTAVVTLLAIICEVLR